MNLPAALRASRAPKAGLVLGVLTAVLAAAPVLAATPAPAFKADAAKGRALAATCVACHTADGTRGAPANPILAGQHPEYIVKQLVEFKSGRRANAIMAGFAAGLSEEDMKHIAAFYAAAKPP
jgi:cytochrome c553